MSLSKSFKHVFLHAPDTVMKAGKNFLNLFENLLGGHNEIITEELKNTLSDVGEEDTPSKRKIWLYNKLRNEQYPELLKVIRTDMLSKHTSLADHEYVVNVPSQIKPKRHFKFLGKNIAHLFILLAEAKFVGKEKALDQILKELMKYLSQDFKNISYKIKDKGKIMIILDNGAQHIVSFLEKFSLEETLGLEKTVELKKY